MALDINDVPFEILCTSTEEVVVADFVKSGGRCESGDMAADSRFQLVGADNHGHGIPADQAFHASFDSLIAGVNGLLVNRYRIDIWRISGERNIYSRAIGTSLQP